jgi:site-specific recombinase xerD
MKKLQEVILKACLQNEADKQEIKDDEFLKLFSDAKRVEGEF